MSNSPRYRHWIQPAGEGLWPTAILCLDCTSNAVRVKGPDVQHRERLTGWNMVCLYRTEGYYYPVDELSGRDASVCLDTIRRIADREAVLWVVSYQCQRVWSLLKLWEGIEDGRIQILNPDYRNSEAQRLRLREYRRRQERPLRSIGGAETSRLAPQDYGYLVIEDPPNILRGRIYGSRHSSTWIDIRNHGIEPPSNVKPGRETASWLADTVKRMCQLCRDNGLTALKPTAGSQAMSAWRHNFLTESPYVHADERGTGIESQSYCGGRCEASTLGLVQSPVVHVDFRSQYGFVCVACPLPVRLDYYHSGDRSQGGSGAVEWHRSICELTVETDEPAYPLRRDGTVIYPTGRFRTVLCGPELADAARLNRIRAVHSVATYDMGEPLKEYAQTMYRLRCEEESEGLPAVATWIKRLIVSLPGKLGQLNHKWVDCPNIMPQTMYGEWYGEDADGELVRYRSVGGIVQRDCIDGYAADSIPSLAAFVTSYGRMRLVDAIRCAGRENVHYYDTDSLMLTEEGYERLQRSTFMATAGMGFLTVRGRYDGMEIRGVKYYVADGKVTCAGLAKGNVVDSGDGVHYQRYLTAVEQARKGLRPEAVVMTGKYLRAEAYGGGTVSPDGKVTPFHLWE